ncbi:MAG: filamentous hemagglutinin N-terminal domain-containing protein [Verrucomicrobia bacterium]|nr:filamentous hemagglutinin N-terminal domain-containing protein [Verrucomicrobiota bacterium]
MLNILGWGSTASLLAGPQGMTVGQGHATVSGAPGNMTIHTSDRVLLNWNSFNIGARESVTFVQPSAASVAWNHITDPNPSQIFGRLTANGVVVLQNSSGFYFGPNAYVRAASLMITTSPGLPPDFAGGGFWQFNGAPPGANIINHGVLTTEKGGSLFLISERIENHGRLEAPEGHVGLLAGERVLVSDRPDGKGLSVEVQAPKGVINNQGEIIADAGTVAIYAQAVNQSGLIRTDTAAEVAGAIEILASERVQLESTSRLQANGEAGAVSPGGSILVKSEKSFEDSNGSRIEARGGSLGGAGGRMEISAVEMSSLNSAINGAARSGWLGGSLLLDPTDIQIGRSGASSTPTLLKLDTSLSFQGLSRITLEATRDITLALNTVWDLSASTGHDQPDPANPDAILNPSPSGSLLSLTAGRNITLQSGSAILAGPHWSIALKAGADFAHNKDILPGVGTVLLQANATIQASDGSIGIQAGQDVTVQTGAIRTTAGGSIAVEAVSGAINTGSNEKGYTFSDDEPAISVNAAELGGISTAAGGNVELSAGTDVLSYFPSGFGSSHADAGSGAFGAAAGDVTIRAGRDVQGHFVLGNGTGTIAAGRDAGTRNRQLALSLIKGSWSVEAAHDILLQEVRNPNGVFNNRGGSDSITRHLFDYDDAASVTLNGRNSVQLLGAALPRNTGEVITSLYAPSLSIEAGAGGVILGNDINLFPSPVGQLSIHTTQGGGLKSSQTGKIRQLTMSDSPRRQFTSNRDFGPTDSEKGLQHLNDPQAARLDIDGNVQDLLVTVPKRLEADVQGNVVNTSLVAQNLRDSDVTRLRVHGDIVNRNDWTFAFPGDVPDMDLLATAVDPPNSQITLDGVKNKFVYTPTTGRLAFQGRMSTLELAYLSDLHFKTFGFDGKPVIDDSGNFVTVPGVFLPAPLLQDIYARSQDVPDRRSQGYQIGGPGRLEVSARHMDLGITEGIVSLGPAVNTRLAEISSRGADIDVQLTGDLSMFSSSVQTRAGGNVTVHVGGTLDVGAQDLLSSSEVARGIYSAKDGDVDVVARNDIRVNGSRIAAYSGGKVHVKSEEGDVDAGDGAAGFVRVQRVLTDHETGAVSVQKRGIPGSGILAIAFPGTDDLVGDIKVEAPKGDIRAGAGGIAQFAFNGQANTSGNVELIAGTPGSDLGGNIQAGRSGVIGGNVRLTATKNVEGVIIAQNNIQINASQNVNVTALASGNVSLNAGGSVSGTVIAGGSVDAGGGKVDATVFASSATGGAVATTANVSAPSSASTAAAATTSVEDSKKGDKQGETPEDKKRAVAASLVKTQGRVTVILPPP